MASVALGGSAVHLANGSGAACVNCSTLRSSRALASSQRSFRGIPLAAGGGRSSTGGAKEHSSSSSSSRTRAQAQAVDSWPSPSAASTEPETVQLGRSEVYVPRLGVGSWSWGDAFFWHEGGWDDRKAKEAKAAFEASVDSGLPFFDTAEVYGQKWGGGDDSETLLGRFIKERQKAKPTESTKVVVATKFAALPWRFGRGSVVSAVKSSLQRLGISQIDLYQLHWPGLWGNDAFVDGLADAVELGLVKAVGVSNYKEQRLRDAYTQLKKRGVILASNQVHYSLVYRNPEQNGVKKACDELGVSLIAYSPLGQGVLTGKYSRTKLPSGARGKTYNEQFMTELEPLMTRMKEIGQLHGGKTPTQVSLNWLLAQGNVIPIPGAKSASQAQEFAGALGWSLSGSEVEELRSIAKNVKPVMGFPAELI
ncbi:hypothetical protein MPTK1_8g01480 [Marchantia polymorpha subsp. ruderalis]|uniref:NADP-dependent oxidoreductase domain-containing protein n=1 Tax=Marchantia polymorpha TaxID=3197 RepID=A0A2R6WR77_MARPO|nr:hypothetical protein MARPO_0064s0050 [Marchantia polymorpha]BBN18305.1 hypothetical protein Mp_8g01480 [Marchantia polymorpha subsp. ruderalis]|eukprot:PTQ36367.1 hypothetical protein MARPO_0064s0050 [Marchantia polymorpha]